MHISLRLNHPRRGWHAALARALSARPGVAVSFDDAPAGPEALPNGRRLAALERLLRPRPGGLAAALPAGARGGGEAAPAVPVDLVIDLRDDALLDAPRVGPKLWRLCSDGSPGEAALFGAALERRTPHASLVDGAAATVAAGRLGTENAGAVAAALEDLLAGAIALIGAALDGAAAPAPPGLPGDVAPVGGTAALRDLSIGGLARRSAKLLAVAAARGAYDLCYDSPRWRVGWRRLDGPDVFALRAHPETGWRALPDDGERFYADPFPIAPTPRGGARAGEVTLFVEDFEYRLGRGVVSAVRFGPDGPAGVPETVLDAGHHLSYPFVFEADGEIWMIPESCSVGRVDLYRARRFPGDWTLEATLVEGATVSDATIHRVGATWWMFGTVRGAGGCFSDHLHLWTAPDFRGPWTPHPRNPVLVDVASARPAGRMVERNGALFRPVQDCRGGYGAALGLARVARLDATGFAQTVETILRPGKAWPGRRLHTLNAAGGFEFIDGSGLPRWSHPARLKRRLRGLASATGAGGPGAAPGIEPSRVSP